MNLYQDELLKLLSLFVKNGVHYLIIGGFAANKYGYHRTTGDIDFYIKDSAENRLNLVNALEQAGYGRFDELLTTQIVAGYCEIMMDNGMYADLMTTIPGLEQKDFDEHYKMATKEEISGVPVLFINYLHLIQNKKATGRPKDLLDIQELEKINKH
jgi:hypothetical protein